MSRLTIAGIELGLYSPPRTDVNRATRKLVLQRGANDLEGSWWDFGKAESFYHVFQTQEDVGFMTYAQRRIIDEKFDNAEGFNVVTDLLGEDGEPETFSAEFDYENPPRFAPKTLNGDLWAFVIACYLKPGAPTP